MSGYSLTALKQHPTRDGVAYVADIRLDDRTVGHVEQDGRGGCSLYRFATRDDEAAYRAAAAQAFPDETFEVEDFLTEKLIVIAEMNRKRAVAFLLDGDDFDGAGVYRQLRASTGLDVDAARAELRRHYGSRNPRVWDRRVSGWVAA